MVSLQDSLQYFKGVGPRKIKLFKKLGISTIEDLLYNFPYRYEDRSHLVGISGVQPGQSYTLKGKIIVKGEKSSWKRRGFHIFEMVVAEKNARIFAVWFNQPYLKNYFKVGQDVILYGRVEIYKNRLQIVAPEFEILGKEGDNSLGLGRIVPIYSATEGFTQRFLRQIIKNALDTHLTKIADPLPYTIRKKYSLLNLAESLINIHFPKDEDSNKEAYRRLAFQEFFFYQIPVVLRKFRRGKDKGIIHKTDGPKFLKLVSELPFQLTAAQENVIAEIKKDMSREYSMQRLLQGEVGSGKTIVSILAAAIALDGGYQVAFMAPTEILAKQHFENICRYFGKSVKSVLLISGLKKKDKDDIYKKAGSGRIDLVVGTHALIQEDLVFKNLGLAVIDEQHKFGVAQRGLLPKKGNNPDTLIMTATPIPRTLSMTIYGDLDVSVIDELPKGRKPIKTMRYSQKRKDEVYVFVNLILRQKRQIYFVCPVIEDSKEHDLIAAQTIFSEFKDRTFKKFKIGLVHGQLNTGETDKIMQDFRAGDIDILVATSILEVGIDMPNATCMVVLQAERFGLSQLHQLRGRIGRGGFESFFIVISDPKTEEAKNRIKAIEELSDGFRIAEEDLRIRGPGEFFGRRQHGLSVLKIANPLTQMRLLKNARDEVFALINSDPLLSQRQNQEILSRIKKSFPEFPRLDLII